jgi:hypothetical protein
MQQNWHLRSRAHHCALTGRPFEEGDSFYTAIYLDPKTALYERRDVAADAWDDELKERTPYSHWKSSYQKPETEDKSEVAPRENAMSMLQRLVEEDDSDTENSRYILALMLERKKQLVPKDVKETETGRLLFYENKKTGDVFVIRDPELRLDELEQVQEEIAFQLGFAGPVEEAAKAVGMTAGPDGKYRANGKSKGKPTPEEPQKSPEPQDPTSAPDADAPAVTNVTSVTDVPPPPEDQENPDETEDDEEDIDDDDDEDAEIEDEDENAETQDEDEDEDEDEEEEEN